MTIKVVVSYVNINRQLDVVNQLVGGWSRCLLWHGEWAHPVYSRGRLPLFQLSKKALFKHYLFIHYYLNFDTNLLITYNITNKRWKLSFVCIPFSLLFFFFFILFIEKLSKIMHIQRMNKWISFSFFSTFKYIFSIN